MATRRRTQRRAPIRKNDAGSMRNLYFRGERSPHVDVSVVRDRKDGWHVLSGKSSYMIPGDKDSDYAFAVTIAFMLGSATNAEFDRFARREELELFEW